MKKFFVGMLSAVMAVTLAACGAPAASDSGSGDTSKSDFKIAMITDSGDITDQSFNQSTYEAVKAFAGENNFDFTYYKPAGDSTPDRVDMIEKAVDEGYNVIVVPGYLFGEAIVQEAPKNKDVKFIVLDVAEGDYLEPLVKAAGEEYSYNPSDYKLSDYVDLSNVYTMNYEEDLSGYMAGYAAVKMGYKHLGFLGGMAVPAVQRFGLGFVQGVDAASSELNVDTKVEYVYGNTFSGDADITAVMDTWVKSLGVDCIFSCGGGIWTSAAEAAKKAGNVKLIGVDTDQSKVIDKDYGEGITITSATKGLAASVKDALTKLCLDNKWDEIAGQIKTLGIVSDDPTENFVQLPIDSTLWNDTFTKDNYIELVKKLHAGEIKVSNDTTAKPESLAKKAVVTTYDNIK